MLRYIKDEIGGLVHEGVQYLDFFRSFDEVIQPESYLEIGTNEGRSLAAFRCDALCVDPNFIVNMPVLGARKRAFFFQTTSDRFFRDYNVRDYFLNGPDVCFLDGLHRFEFVLRDFINAEACCHRNSVIFLHDCLPSNYRMAERAMRVDESEDFSTRNAWTGDVWRMLPTLKKYRPEMRVLLLDCGPTGLVACTGLEPTSDVLGKAYSSIVDDAMRLSLETIGLEQLWRTFPMVDTGQLCANPADLTAVFNIY